MFWQDLFHIPIPILEKVIRAIAVYLFLVIGLRLAGKRELAQINTLDLVVLLTLSNTVQNAIIGPDDSLLGGLIGGATLLIANYTLVGFLFKKPKLAQLLEGKADDLIVDGVIQEKKLVKELITLSELEVAARKQGFDSLEEIQTATLEPGGSITFKTKKDLTQAQILERLKELSDDMSELKVLLKDKT